MPRPGQWMKFHVSDKLAKRLREAGCFETQDGYFLAIWDAGLSQMETNANGEAVSVVKRPARLMPCDRKGNNVVVIQDGEPRNLGFALSEVQDLCPMTSKEHYPPEYVGNTHVDPLP